MNLVALAVVAFGAAAVGVIAGTLLALWLLVTILSPPRKE